VADLPENKQATGEVNMSTISRYCFLFAVTICLLVNLPLLAEEGIRGNLVDVGWLEKNLKSPNLVILDASPETYAAKHIAGALSVNIYDLFAYGFGGISDAKVEQLFQSWGISPGKKIVVYDKGGDHLAPRLFFDLDYHGVPTADLFILDGGLAKWQEQGLPVTKDATPAPKNGTFKITKLKDDLRGGLPEVVTASGDTANNALVEGLDPDWHFGAIAPFDRAGHIPNGILASSADFYNPDKTFKSPEEIKKMLTYLGVRPEQQIYTYCGGGVAATVPFFAAKFIADYPKVKLFPESELGWLSDQRSLPYWTYDAPFLMRETGWLQFWSGRMIRMFLGAPISIVDVRPASAFNQGHIPFSLNIPGEVFKANAASPAKLAEVLGPAGVNPSDEAVVISGAGLTKESALAFVMLEKLGQKKVSLFMDSMDTWTQRGQQIAKDPTVVRPRKGPHDLSIPPTNYPEAFRKEVVITDPQSTHGVYPKVYVASGKDMPTKSQDGKVIHVPYTDLVNADGTPKAAKDIWSILAKAGVPRYAELVCISDDPGEAAVNYFILKLMGFPDIKVLVT
jgi:3-mercaptopyruvate sulfurtransferase SseA